MQFMKDLWHWFLYGTVEDSAVETQTAHEPVVEQPAIKKKEEPVLNVVDDILASGKGENFLKELQSLKSIKKQFDKERTDLINDIKRLSPKKKH